MSAKRRKRYRAMESAKFREKFITAYKLTDGRLIGKNCANRSNDTLAHCKAYVSKDAVYKPICCKCKNEVK